MRFGHGGPRAVGRRAKPNSSRNGAERVTCFIAPDDEIDVAYVCKKLEITRGQLLMLGVAAAKAQLKTRRRRDEETGAEAELERFTAALEAVAAKESAR